MAIFEGIGNSRITEKPTTCVSTVERNMNLGMQNIAPKETNHKSMHW